MVPDKHDFDMFIGSGQKKIEQDEFGNEIDMYPDGIDRSGQGKLVLTKLGKMRRKIKPRMIRLPDNRIFIEDRDEITTWEKVQKAFETKELKANAYIWDDTPWRQAQANIKFKMDRLRAMEFLKNTGKVPPDDIGPGETYDQYTIRKDRVAMKLKRKRR